MIKLIALFMVLLGTPGRDSVKSETGEVPACLREYFTAARDSAWEPNAGDVFFAVTPGPREGGLYREAWSDSTQLLTPLIHYNMKCKGRYLIFSHENVDMKRQHRFYSGKKKPAQSPLLVVRSVPGSFLSKVKVRDLNELFEGFKNGEDVDRFEEEFEGKRIWIIDRTFMTGGQVILIETNLGIVFS